MPFETQSPTFAWQVLTHMGSASLLMPMVVLMALGFWMSGQRRLVWVWLPSLGLAAFLTLVSKILFMGWGIGSAFLNFTGISGHTVLASSVLPVLFSALFGFWLPRKPVWGVVVGLALAVGVGVSRVVLGAHSASEVTVGWLMGLAVTLRAVTSLAAGLEPPRLVRLAPWVLLLALHTGSATYLPSHSWEVRFSLWLSGHDQPFARDHLLQKV
jgi:membrane-associated phospholipid phosphatase